MECIKTRRSIRKYKTIPISEAQIAQLIESARIAPSGSNTQPWHFIVVRSEETKRKLTEVSYNQKWMLTAPVHIVCIADLSVRVPDSGLILEENSPEFAVKQIIRDTAIAVEHMVLEAESMWLGTCWIAKFEQEKIRPVLKIPADKFVVCILTVGYPDETPAERPRKKTEEIVHYECW